MKKKKPVNYINNKQLYSVMLEFYEKTEQNKKDNKELPQIPNYVGQCFLKICNGLSNRPNFAGYSYKDEMIGDAIENCVTAAYGFNPHKSTNPFAYFTQIAWFAMVRRITKEKKQNYIKHKNFQNNNLMDEFLTDNYLASNKSSDYSEDVINNFEESERKRKKGDVEDDSDI